MKLKKILIRLLIFFISIIIVHFTIWGLVGYGMNKVDWKGVADEYVTKNGQYKISIIYGYNMDPVSTNIRIITYRLSDNKKIIVADAKAYDLVFKFREYENGDVNVINENSKGGNDTYEIKWDELY